MSTFIEDNLFVNMLSDAGWGIPAYAGMTGWGIPAYAGMTGGGREWWDGVCEWQDGGGI